MLRFIALRGVRAHENVEHSQRRENVIYRDRRHLVELLLQLNCKTNNKICKIMWILITSTCIRYILEIFPLARLTCIVTSQVSWKCECDEA